MTLNDLDNDQNKAFSEVFGLQHTCLEWTAPKWLEIDQDKMHMEFF